MPAFKQLVKDIFTYKKRDDSEGFILKETAEERKSGRQTVPTNKKDPSEDLLKKRISGSLDENLVIIRQIYNMPQNIDIKIREFAIDIKGTEVDAFIVFIDGLVNKQMINASILQPLMILSSLKDKTENNKSNFDFIIRHLMTNNELGIFDTFEGLVNEVNFGSCALFVDGSKEALTMDVKGWEHRTVERPNTELLIRGPQEGFTEVLKVNVALVRKIIKDENLVTEKFSIGKRSKTPCVMMYIKTIANDSLVNEVRRRLGSIKIDYIFDSGELEQLIEDHTLIPAPQVLATERPDRAAGHIADGKVAVLLQGSPFAIVMPITFIELMHSPEDAYFRFPYGNFMRIIRIMGYFMTLLLPGFYVAITNFHQEMIPTNLLIAIDNAREKVPFPSIVEILIMEISFELIREAGIRIPGPIGPTLGIIGALILGQAAVAANIISPILIIIVALTGLGSFAMPNFSFAFATRILRFLFIILGASAGFLGITVGLFIQGTWLASAKSFGARFLSPFAPRLANILVNDFTRAPIWKQEKRSDYTNAKVAEKQEKISRKWKGSK